MEATTNAASASNAGTTAQPARNSLKVAGLVSGIDSSAIVDALINADAGPKRALERQKTLLDARRQAVRTLNTRLLSASIDLSRLKLSSTFGARSATTSQTDAVTATAGSAAQPGTYEFNVVSTAKAHQVATAGRSSNTSAQGAGTITVQVGTGASQQIAIDGSSSSLNDIASAINAAGAGLQASVVNQGGTNPYRLVLQGQKSGADQDIAISATGALSGLFTGLSELTTAADAEITIGSDNPITVRASSNQVTSVIPGVTLNLLKTSTGPVRLTVTQDTTAVVDAVKAFVTSANEALTYARENSSFDKETKQAGILVSESDIKRSIGSMVRALTSTVGSAGSGASLASVGVTLDRDSGLLELDEGDLKDALAANADNVAKLFTNTGTSSVNSVRFAALTGKTRTDRAFAVDITTAAAQAQATGTAALAASTSITSANNRLDLEINGTAYSASIATGTYTSREDLAAAVGRAISGLTGQGDQVSVGTENDQLTITSKNFGSNQAITVLGSSTALTDLRLAAGRRAGVDVIGTVDGQSVTGNGQILYGKAGTSSEGLAMVVTATAPVSGVSIRASKGVAQLADEQIKALTDVDRGLLNQRDRTLVANMETLSASIKRKDTLLAERRTAYERRFIAMEKSIASLQSQGNFLSSQIAGFNRSNNNS
jgi:flagellar hook-associated protein 2